MSNGITKFHDDKRKYLRLCKKYNEEPKTRNLQAQGIEYIDPYSEHAKTLKRRDYKDRGIEVSW